MKLILYLAVTIVAFCHYGEAGENFPPEAQFLTMQTFRKINPDIEEDWTDYMQELAGEFTTCEEIFIHQGHWELIGKRAPNGDRVGALIDYVAWETTDRQGLDAIAKRTFEKWIETFPYNEQIRIADHYGCSVAAGCPAANRGTVQAPRGYAVVGCGFFPTCPNEGCVPDRPPTRPPTRPPPPPQFDVRALAFTPEQYAVAESLFYGKRWDRTHLLEDMSGTETDCSMIGQSQWQFTKAQTQARPRGLDIYGRFGYTLHTGNTPDPMMKILREIRDAEQSDNQVGRQIPGNLFGCSIIPDCFSRVPGGRPGDREGMYVVVSCLFSRTEIRQDNFRRNPAGFRSGGNEPPRTLPARPNPRPQPRPNPRPNQPLVRASDVNSPIQPNFLPPNRDDRRGEFLPARNEPVQPIPQRPGENEFLPHREPVKPLPRRGDQGDQAIDDLDNLNLF